jgi:hypothetical protein
MARRRWSCCEGDKPEAVLAKLTEDDKRARSARSAS